MRGLNLSFPLLALALISPAIALADGVFHPTGQSFACVNPRATRALANHADPRQNDPGWVHFVITDGRCFQVDPSEKWEQISQENGLLLLRRDPPRTGMPPLFFLPQQVSSGVPIPPQPSAETPTDGPVQLAPASPDPETPQASDKVTDLLPKGWENRGMTRNRQLPKYQKIILHHVRQRLPLIFQRFGLVARYRDRIWRLINFHSTFNRRHWIFRFSRTSPGHP